MKTSRAALRYAKALLSHALDHKSLEQVAQDMQQIVEQINQQNEIARFLDNAIVPAQNKLNAVKEIFASAHPTTHQLFDLLKQNKRIDILQAVAENFLKLYDAHLGNTKARVITAIPLDETTRQKVLEKAATLTTAKVSLENTVDPQILGGFILRVGDLEYNASIAYQLEAYKRALTKTNYSA